ncbi:unnamed protein product [Lepeophtheirus salmonis]|uniref:(salmon louse) hypothetical protein n=1 Tax=Lepeophtheirus salmonis TaxID=72036 RepID=A0A0K2V1X8_LEPSM|nr:uncharacterized protein LOC121131963 [Lepeophtheirus salmonis]CAB4055824.1 unnamed protein product [Lepeophtheirus salmonis]CAF2781790.1 unnamed protein product [Lepeophtheirus salmonis]
MSRLLLLILGLTSIQMSMGLKCWNSPLSTTGRPDPFIEINCGSNSKSCRRTEYKVAGMTHIAAECSNEDKKTCSDQIKGSIIETTCFCNTDFCNSGMRARGIGVMSLVLGICAIKAFAT